MKSVNAHRENTMTELIWLVLLVMQPVWLALDHLKLLANHAIPQLSGISQIQTTMVLETAFANKLTTKTTQDSVQNVVLAV
jgi:hypothetical protein